MFLGMTTGAQTDEVGIAVVAEDAALRFVVNLDGVRRPARDTAIAVALEDLAPASLIGSAAENFTAIRQRAGAAARMGSNAGFTMKGLPAKQQSN
jgi:hypothetical protein